MGISINTISAKDGTEILEIQSNGKVYRMNSAYGPYAEAEKFAGQYQGLEEGSVLLVFGYGNGIFPRALMKACSERMQIVFYEPSTEILRGIKNIDEELEQIFSEKGYIVAPEKLRDDKRIYLTSQLPKLLEQLVTYSNYNKIVYTALPKYRDVFPEEYKHFQELIAYRINKFRSNIATAKYMGHDAVVNNIRNLRHIPESYCGDSFAGIFPEDMPAIIVSAGPSLEKNVQDLKQAKGKALIVCTDSAIKYLLRQNVMSDLLVTVDPLKPLQLFDDERINGIPIVGSPDMNYRILEKLPHSKVIFASSENTYIQQLYGEAGHHIERLESGGSVATLAFSLCRYWGFSHIILTGQDLALADRQRYVGQGVLPSDNKRQLLEVEDIYGKTVYAPKDYYSYLKWFEQAIAAHPEVRVIDATEGGAKIAGTEVMTLQEALSEYEESDFDFGEYMKTVKPAFSDAEKEDVNRQIRNSRNRLCLLLEKLQEGIALSEKGLALCRQGGNGQQLFQLIDAQIQEICEYYNELEESFFIQREIDATCLEEFVGLFEREKAETKGEQYAKLFEYFSILKEAATTVSGIWENVLI